MHTNGFSLLEMLITLTLVALLSLLGNAAYTHFIHRANGLLAKQTLMNAAADLERYALINGNYQGANLHLPENTGYAYQTNIGANTYTITAQPTNPRNNSRFSIDETGTLHSDDTSPCVTN